MNPEPIEVGMLSSPPVARLWHELHENTPEADAFLTLLADVVSGENGAAIRPAGAKTELLNDNSTAWQIFSELPNLRIS